MSITSKLVKNKVFLDLSAGAADFCSTPKYRELDLHKDVEWFTRVHGFRAVVFQKSGEWSVGITDCAGVAEQMIFFPKRYVIEDEAKALAFDTLVYMEKPADRRPGICLEGQDGLKRQ